MDNEPDNIFRNNNPNNWIYLTSLIGGTFYWLIIGRRKGIKFYETFNEEFKYRNSLILLFIIIILISIPIFIYLI